MAPLPTISHEYLFVEFNGSRVVDYKSAYVIVNSGMRYRPGGSYRVCDRCGFRVRASQTMKDWDGQIVCLSDWDGRHPQDFVRSKSDRQAVPGARGEALDTFLTANQITRASL